MLVLCVCVWGRRSMTNPNVFSWKYRDLLRYHIFPIISLSNAFSESAECWFSTEVRMLSWLVLLGYSLFVMCSLENWHACAIFQGALAQHWAWTKYFLPIKAVITDMPELYEGRSGRRRQEQLLNAAMESLKWGVGKGEDARFNSWNYGFVQGTWVKSSCPAESRLDAACSWALWCFSFFDNTCNDC